MNEEKLKQILREIGKTGVPPNIAQIAEQNRQSFAAGVRLLRANGESWLTGFKRIAIAACIVTAFLTGRWSIPLQAPTYPLYDDTHETTAPLADVQNDGYDFWRQKALAATQPRPYAQTSFAEIHLMNTYKQYLKEEHYE
jgi:hypothetical protein